MRIGLIAMSGVRVRTPELAELGVTLPQFVNRGKVVASLPSLGLLTVAALTPEDVDVEYREIGEVDPDEALEPFDLVGISSFSAQIDEAYALADRYRQAGTAVVLGGLHVSLMPDEAADDMPKTRFFGNALLSIMTKMASGYYKIFDVVDGYTAITRRAINLVNWDKAWKGYGYPMDFLVRLNAYGLKVRDVPRRAIYLEGERQSQIKGFPYAVRVAPMLVRGFFWRLFTRYLVRDFHPLFFFYLFGLILVPLGVLYGGYLIYLQWSGQGVSGPRSVVCALMIIMGIQFQLFAMLYDMQESE